MINHSLKINRRGYLNVGVTEQYKMYKKTVEKPIGSIVTYRAILSFMFSRIWFYCLTELWIFKAPHNFGEFYIAESLTSKGFFKNWQKSKEKGKVVKSYNMHSSGRKFFIKWEKILTKVKGANRYQFKPYRGKAEDMTGKRGLAYWIKHCSTNPHIPDFRGHII